MDTLLCYQNLLLLKQQCLLARHSAVAFYLRQPLPSGSHGWHWKPIILNGTVESHGQSSIDWECAAPQPVQTLVLLSQVFCRCFNGLHTIYDLKKWVRQAQWAGEQQKVQEGATDARVKSGILTMTRINLVIGPFVGSMLASKVRLYLGKPAEHRGESVGVSENGCPHRLSIHQRENVITKNNGRNGVHLVSDRPSLHILRHHITTLSLPH